MISPRTATTTPTACSSRSLCQHLLTRLHHRSGGLIHLLADGLSCITLA